MNSKQKSLSGYTKSAERRSFPLFRGAIGTLLLIGSAGAAPAGHVPPPKTASAVLMRQLGRIGGDLRDFQSILDARMTDPGSGRPWTFKVRLAFKLPDSFRMDVLSSSNPVIRGWKMARVGSSVRVYDPISERATSLDFAKITGKQPLRADIGLDLLAGVFHPSNYTVAGQQPTTLEGKPVVLLRLKPRPGLNDPRSVMRLSHILLWMDLARKAPLMQESYGVPLRKRMGNRPVQRLFTIRFGDFKSEGRGLWYPEQVELTRDRTPFDPDASQVVRFKLIRMNGALVPTEIVSTGIRGTSVMRNTSIKVNAGLPDSTFRPES